MSGRVHDKEMTLPDENRSVEVSDNIFADLGLPDAEEYNTKAQLALAIRRVIRERGMTQKAAALQAHLSQPDISNITNGRLDGIGLERLIGVLNNLDQDVEIQVRQKRAMRARTYVSSGNSDPIMSLAMTERKD